MNARLEAKDLPCLFDSLVEGQLVSVEYRLRKIKGCVVRQLVVVQQEE
jgi:hypothetical protein